MARKGRYYDKETIQKVDKDTGEVNVETVSKEGAFDIESDPAYFKFFLNDMEKISSLLPKIDQVFFRLLLTAGYDNRIHISAYLRRKIMRELKVSLPTFNNTLKKYTGSGIMKREERGVFFLNPYIFAKGKWPEIKDKRNSFETKEEF